MTNSLLTPDELQTLKNNNIHIMDIIKNDITYTLCFFYNEVEDSLTRVSYLDGELHNTDIYAYIIYKANKIICKKSYLNGNLSSINNLPACVIYYNTGDLKTEEWYDAGKFHRADGPACIQYSETGEITEAKFMLYGNTANEKEIILDKNHSLYTSFIKYNKLKYPVEYAELLKKESQGLFD